MLHAASWRVCSRSRILTGRKASDVFSRFFRSSGRTLRRSNALLKKKAYVRAVSPRLRRLLYFIFAVVALLGANAAYLASITWLEWITGRTYQNYFYQYMFLVHLLLGLVLILPFLVFGFLHMWAARNRRNRWAVRSGLRVVCRGGGGVAEWRVVDAGRWSST